MNKVQEIAGNGLVLLDRVNITGKSEALALIELAGLLEGLKDDRYRVLEVPQPQEKVETQEIKKPEEVKKDG